MFQARYAEAIDQGLIPAEAGTVNDVGGGVKVLPSFTDHSPGPMKKTGMPTDLAIRGRGFFVVEREGVEHLTRAGNLMITAEGLLTTQDGLPVLSEEGGPIVLNGPFQFAEDGTFQSVDGVQRLALAEPVSLGDLSKVGENLFLPLAPTQPLPTELRSVAQGFIEGSGTSAVREMTEMIETTRAYEANVNMIRHHDQMFGTLISRVLKVN
jgi:flagellar basal body rod protein FlgG